MMVEMEKDGMEYGTVTEREVVAEATVVDVGVAVVEVEDSDDADSVVEDAVVDDVDADAELVGRVMDVMEKDGME